MLFLELTPISSEDENDLLDNNSDNDPQFSSLIRSINQNTLNALKFYDEYYAQSQKACAIPFQDEYSFEAKLGDYIKEHGPFTRDSWDEYCDRELGEVHWYQIEW